MITHDLKVAIRNLLKYKVQTGISMLGLAAGFICFVLSAFWIHYEMSYDQFRKDADRLYLVRVNDGFAEGRITWRVPVPLGAYLQEHFPEIESFAPFTTYEYRVKVEGRYEKAILSSADSAWVQMMDVQLVDGNRNFMQQRSKEVAITEETAKAWFGHENPLGKELEIRTDDKRTIGAVVRVNNRHTNFPIALMGDPRKDRTWWNQTWMMLVKVEEGTDIPALEAKISENLPYELIHPNEVRNTGIERLYLTPLTELRYAKDFRNQSEGGITFRYIVYFSVTGLLVILCALMNYLTLFINRMQVRKREMKLRLVHGASIQSLVRLLGLEFLLLLIGSFLIGMLGMEILFPAFLELTGTDAGRTSLYGEALLFLILISVLLLGVAIGVIYGIQRRQLQGSGNGESERRFRTWIRKGSIVFQLFICMLFMTGTQWMNRQLDYLRQHDLGMELHNRGYFALDRTENTSPFVEKLKQLPMITEVLPADYRPLVSDIGTTVGQIYQWEGLEQKLDVPMPINLFVGDETLARFYGLTLLAGEWLNEFSGYGEIVINESLARRMGYTPEEAVGKHIRMGLQTANQKIKGVVKDFQYKAPTEQLPNTGFIIGDEMGLMLWKNGILFRFKEGTWDACRTAIEQLCRKEAPDKEITLVNEEESYNKYLQSEAMLARLLAFASLICMLVAIFGIYSLVTLTCEQRRKEIAIRKVNGATVRNILSLFYREYIVLLLLAALPAFPLAYILVKHWIETYTRQMSIPIAPALGVFLVLLLVVGLSISWRVWRAAHENPAEVIKRE
jgi:hypothetical protein